MQQELKIRQINQAVTGITQYPFSRAQRLELSGGVRRISFSQQLRSDYFNFLSGQFLGTTKEKLESPEALNLGEASAALVWDTSVFGATSPIVGQRYRFELSESSGSLQYTAECEITATSSCAQFDRLIGSRMLVSNVELRAPLIGLFRPSAMYGGVPIEVGVFADAGVAWDSVTKPKFAGGDRDWAKSVGATVRFNAFGFAVGEVDYVKPLDRPDRGWMWQFNFIPGF